MSITQLTLDQAAGAALKDHGHSSIEQTDPAFVAVMREMAKALSERDGSVTTDALRLWAVSQGMYPKHQNAYGTIFKGPHWKIIGRKYSAIPSNHGRSICIWKYEA